MKKKIILTAALLALVFISGCNLASNSDTDEPKASTVIVDTKVTVKDGFISDFKEYKVNFKYDPSIFVNADNTKYNPEIAKLTVLLASDMYSNCAVVFEGAKTGPTDYLDIYNKMNLKDIEYVVLKKEDFNEDFCDLTAAMFAHQEYTIDNQNYSLIFVTVRGTDGTFEQWSSNFDPGADDELYYSKTGDHSLWTNKDHHKGFDIAANRLNDKLSEYLQKNTNLENTSKILVFTGHSRGAAISNILGASYEKAGEYKTFTYSFATPRVSTNKNDVEASKTVFNILNEDDIVTVMPLNKWGFSQYGTIKSASIGEEENAEKWKNYTGVEYASAKAQEAETGWMAGVADSREDLYKFDESEGGKLTISAADETEKQDVEAFINKYSLNKYIKDFNYDNGAYTGYVCPAYSLQLLSVLIDLTNNNEKVSNKLSFIPSNHLSFIFGFARIGKDMHKSHTVSSYILLSQIITE